MKVKTEQINKPIHKIEIELDDEDILLLALSKIQEETRDIKIDLEKVKLEVFVNIFPFMKESNFSRFKISEVSPIKIYIEQEIK